MALPVTPDPPIKFTVDAPLKGVWTHASPASCPAQTWPTLTNVDLPAGVITTMAGNEVFLDNDYPTGTTITLLLDRRVAGAATEYLLAVQGAAAGSGAIYKWVTNDWVLLRKGLTGIATAAVWWSWVQYGTDVYLSNPSDGVYRYDGTRILPCGAKYIATMETGEAALWAGGAAETTVWCEGLQSRKISTGAHAAAAVTMVYTPASALDTTTGRYQARAYAVSKSPGTDFYHFKFLCTDISLIDTTNTSVLFTTSGGNTLAFPATTWDTDRSGTALNVATASDSAWMDIYLPTKDGTQVGTYNPASVASVTFSFDSTGASVDCSIDDCYAIYAVTMPAVQILAEWKNMLWGARTTANPDTLFYSPVQAPDEYDALATLPIKARGEAITGLSSFFSQLTIPCDTTTHSLSGSTTGATYPAYVFDQQMVSHEFGGSSHRSIVEANNRLYWWYNDMIVEYRGTGLAKISYAVDVTLDLADKTKLDYIVGAQFQTKNQLWWTWKRTAGTVNDRILRYDYIEGAFLTTEGLATPLLLRTFSSGIERLLTVDANDADVNRRIFRQDSTTLKFMAGGTNTDIAYTVELPPLALPNVSMEWDFASLQYLTNTGNLIVAYRVADHLRALAAASYTTLETIDQGAAGELGKIRLGDRSPYLQLRLTSTAVPFQIQCPVVVWTRSMGDERGTA